MKRFFEWILIKEKIDSRLHQPPLVSEGDLWWCSLGENVGVEVTGKDLNFTRPIVIVKKFGRMGFLGIPTTTKPRMGSWYVSFVHKGTSETAMLNQARTLSYKRLGEKMGSLNETDFKNVKEAFVRLFIDGPPSQEVAGQSRIDL